MNRIATGLAGGAILLLTTLGGCPGPANPGGGGTVNTAGGVVTGDGRGGGVSGAPDVLAERYPGCAEAADGDAWRDEVLRLVNEARRREGLAPLAWNPLLEAQATAYACEMIHYGFFSHNNPVTGSSLADRVSEFGYEYWTVGENLAAGQRTPEEVVRAWLESPCHKQNILNPAFTELGVGVRVGGYYGVYWVQEFGRPLSAGPYTGPVLHVPGCAH